MPEFNYDDYYTIEFKGPKGWEVYNTYDRSVGISKVTELFVSTVVNDRGDMQWRLTTPTT